MKNSPTKPLVDPAAIAVAIRMIVEPGGVTELRALEATTHSDRGPRTWSGYFDDADKLAAAVGDLRTAKGIYFVPNPVESSLLARAANRLRKTPKGECTSDTNITRRRRLLVDCDALRPSGVSATDAEHEAAIERALKISAWLSGQGWPEPIVADSGNGGHLLYSIDLPAEDGGVVSRCLQALAARFDDEVVKVDKSVFNPSRIWKLYGTLACKGDDTPERPHRLARIISSTENPVQVTLAQLEALAAAVADADLSANGSERQDGFDVESFIERNGLEVTGPSAWQGEQGRGQSWTLRLSPLCDHHDDGPYLLRHASGAISAGCHHDSCDWNWSDLRNEFKSTEKGGRGAKGVAPAVAEERFQAFPVESLPKRLKKFVREGAQAIGCDASYIALPLLSVLAAAIGNTRCIQLKPGWNAPAILWTAIIGESGSAKTPAFQLAQRAVKARQAKAVKAHQEEEQKYQSVLAFFEKDMSTWKRKNETGENPPKQPDPPLAERFCVNDTTIEALAPILQANPRGLLLARDELAGWLASFDKYSSGKGGGDASQWLSMHDGEGLIVDRKTGMPRTIFVPNASVSISGGIQPGILRRALGIEHRESGLAARLLLAYPPRRIKRWTDAEISPALEESIAQLHDRLLTLEPSVNDQGDSSPVVAKLTSEAMEEWKTFYNEHAAEQVELSGDLAAAWSKLEECPARLALVIHCVRWASGDESLEGPDLVDVESMRTGITLTNWFKREARRVYAMLSESEADHTCRQLVDWIERRGGEASGRDVQIGHRQFRTAKEAEAALQQLVEAKYGVWIKIPSGPQGGRPTRVFRLSTTSTSTQPLETGGLEGFVDVDSVDACAELPIESSVDTFDRLLE